MSERIFGQGQEDFKQAEWLADQLAQKWRYDFSTEQWHHFDGVRWAADKTQRIMRTVAEKAARGISTTDREETRKALTKLLSNGPIERALMSLATLDGYGTDGEDWDTVPYLMGCKNGIVDLRHNQLVPATPDMLVTRSTGVPFESISGPSDFATVAPRFVEFLAEVTSDYDWTEDASMVGFLLLWFGASLFGITPEQRFLLMTGSGRNGKGALKHAITSAVGSEYSIQPDANLYSRNKMGPARSNEARSDLMSLKGRRIAFFSEPDRGQFNEEMLKAHTGGDTITARNLYQRNTVSWEPTHSITFLVNDAPSLEDVGPSMGSRVMVADFRHRYEGADEDKTLYGTLHGERAGVLSILCWAAAAWFASWESKGEGISLPPRVVEQSKQFIERNDPIAECLRDVFVIRPDLTCPSQVAYDTYKEWHARSGREDDPVSTVKFAAALEKRGMRKTKGRMSNFWTGLKPLSSVGAAETDDDE